MPQSQTYKDFNITFKSHPVTKDLLVVKDETAIKQSIRSLLLTNHGERLFNPDIGTDLRRILFDILDFATASDVRLEIYRCLTKYEPRIRITDIEVTPDEERNGYDIQMQYVFTSRNNPPVSIEFFLERTRN